MRPAPDTTPRTEVTVVKGEPLPPPRSAGRRFDVLGHAFKPRQAINRRRRLFTSFSPAVSDKVDKAKRHEIRGWDLQRLSRYDLGELLEQYRPVLAG